MRVVTVPGVFKPIVDTWMLAECMRAEPSLRGGEVLDLCTGSGALAVSAALSGAREVTAVDVSRRSVLTVGLNARLNGVRVRTRRGDLFAPVRGERFDLIVSNPPYVPSPGDDLPASAGTELPRRGPERAWEGGPDGRVVIDRICAEVRAHLRPGGRVMLVHSSVCGERATLDALARSGLEGRVVARRKGSLGPLMSARVGALEQRGLLAPGAREEELLVIEGRADGAG